MKDIICIVCPQGCRLRVDEENDFAVSGNRCEKGADYGRAELLNPTRVLTSTVDVEGSHIARCPVKTDGAIPKAKIFEAMEAVREVCLAAPVKCGQIVIENILGTGVNLVATRDMEAK